MKAKKILKIVLCVVLALALVVGGHHDVFAFPITSALRRSLPIETGFTKLLDLDRCYSVSRIPVDGGGVRHRIPIQRS